MRATQAIIHLSHLRGNIAVVRQLAQRPICAAVKANGYGHGAVEVARLLLKEGIAALGVATVEEALLLRMANIRAPLMLYSLATPSELYDIALHDLQPFVCDIAMCKALAEAARQAQKRVALHLKIDTGMGRIGAESHQLPMLVDYIKGCPELQLAGIATHYANATDAQYTIMQYKQFQKALRQISFSSPLPMRHAANSGAIIAQHVDLLDMVRPGIMLYGYHPDPQCQAPSGILPVMELQSQIVFLKRVQPQSPISYGSAWRSPRSTIIATIPIGYGDGLPRLLSNNGYVAVHSKNGSSHLAPIVGHICMDQLMIDVGHITEVACYDRVTLFGPEALAPDAADVARRCGTISYEILTSISARVPHHYR